jgi:YidC/Oxa1 family membrane protein insertase
MNIDASANPQTAIMNKLMLYLFPLFVVVGGPFFPLAILFYWLASNTWTFGQLWAAHKIQDRRAAANALVVEQAKEASRFSTPPPGARPKRSSNRPVVSPSKIGDSPGGSADGPAAAAQDDGSAGSSGSPPDAQAPGGKPPPGSRPAPGAKPQRNTGSKKKRSSR